MGHLPHTFLFFKLLWSLPWDSNEGEACVFVCAQAHTHTRAHPQDASIRSFLHPSAAPPSFTAQSRGPVGVFSGVVGADGGRARAQVPAVADTGRETDEDGHRALCSGG